MKRLFAVLTLLVAGVLLLSGAGMIAGGNESASQLEAQTSEASEAAISAPPSQEAQPVIAPLEEQKRGPRLSTATIILFGTLAVAIAMLAALCWLPGRGRDKQSNRREDK